MKIIKRIRLCVVLSALFYFGFMPVSAQVIQEITGKLNLYQQKYPEETVYVQTDRTNYSPGEIIWFKAYIMEDIGDLTNSLSRSLYVALIDRDSTIIQNKVVYIENNMAGGSIEIPAMITAGNYKFVAHTSWMKNTPLDRVFSREIVIDNAAKEYMLMDVRLNETIYQPNTGLTANLSFKDAGHKPVPATFAYRLTGPSGILLEGKGKAEKNGEAAISLALPSFGENDNLHLFIDASYKSASVRSGAVLPTAYNALDVFFYPEGGSLVYGADSKIAFRAFNSSNRPVDFEGEILTAQNEPVQLIKSTYEGIGTFSLTPERGQTYYLRITKPAGISKTFKLPVPRRSGVLLSVAGKSADTLTLKLTQVNKYTNVYYLLGQVKGRVFWMESISAGNVTRIKVPMDNFPSGIAEFAVFDTAKNLVAKRLVFLNEHKKMSVEITTDKQQYAPREKVVVTVKVKDENGDPVRADLSVAVVNREMLIPDNTSLLTYSILKSDLIGYIPNPQYYFKDTEISKEVLDNLLIANAFNRFTWRTVLDISSANIPFVPMDASNDPITDMYFTKSVAAWVARDLIDDQNYPGRFSTVQDKNNMDRILSPVAAEKKHDPLYDPGKSIREIIFQIKPYTIISGKIVFNSSGPNSINSLQGAAIALNGTLMGTDISVLDGIPVIDIDHINVSTNPIDVAKYTSLNSMGIIEVYTKSNSLLEKADTRKKITTEEAAKILPARFESPDYSLVDSKTKTMPDLRRTVFWRQDLRTDYSGQTIITFYNGDIPSAVDITAEGRTAAGIPGIGTGTYLVK